MTSQNNTALTTALTAWLRDSRTQVVKLAVVQGLLDVHAAIADAEMEPVVVSMQGAAGVDIASAARTPVAVTFRRKVIVVEDYDGIASHDAVLCAAIGSAIKLNRVPVILIAQTTRARKDLPKGHAVFLGAPPDDAAHAEIRAISHFDARIDANRDKGLSGAEAALAGVVGEYRGDGIALGAVFDNYPTVPDGGLGVVDAAFIADAFSAWDHIAETMARAGTYDDPYSGLPVSAAAAAFRGIARPAEIRTFGCVWSKTNAMHAKTHAVNAIAKSTSRENIDMLRWGIGAAIKRGDVQAAADLAKTAGLDAPMVLAVMRLWKSGYTLASHAKLRKLL